jgi:octaprenyl-diphosphate synthase
LRQSQRGINGAGTVFSISREFRRPWIIMQTKAHRSLPSGLHAGAPRTRIESASVDIAAVFALLQTEMQDAEATLHEQLQLTIPAVAEIGRYLVLAGGKRLRPLVTGLGARAAGLEGDIGALMCIGELLHLGSLLHDDVVDEGLERRGKAAAQRVYGNAAVILTGDFCVARGLQLAGELGGLQAAQTLAATVAEMSEGEVTQLLNAGNLNLSPETYLEIVHKKSASLIAWCAAVGAWASDKPERARALYTFGQSVGAAFQITDDVLDYTGEKDHTGKRRGRDLAERKCTLPLILAMDRIDGLRDRLALGDPSPERIPYIIDQVIACGATADALEAAKTRVQTGIAALDGIDDTPHRAALITLAHHLVERIA